MTRKGLTGASLGGVELSPRRRKRLASQRRAQERKWAARSGPVTVIKPGSGSSTT